MKEEEEGELVLAVSRRSIIGAREVKEGTREGRRYIPYIMSSSKVGGRTKIAIRAPKFLGVPLQMQE